MHILTWQPQIGDPTFAGWFTVFSYFLTAWLCLRASRRLNTGIGDYGKTRLFWLALAMLMLLLGVNKQLDLQSLLTAIGKYYAHEQGWYKSRRTVQAAFILMILTAGAGVLVWGLHYFKEILSLIRLAFSGIVFLGMFILMRATSFHHMDQLIGLRLLGLKMNWILELSGIYCIAVNAYWMRKLSHK